MRTERRWLENIFLSFFRFKRTVPEERGKRESERKYDFESLKRKAGLRGGGLFSRYVTTYGDRRRKHVGGRLKSTGA